MKVFNYIIKGLCSTFVLIASVTNASDWGAVPNQIQSELEKQTFNRFTRTYTTNIKIENYWKVPTLGDFRVVLKNSNVNPVEPDGTTDDGDPYYLAVVNRIQGSETVTVQVNFKVSGRVKPSVTFLVQHKPIDNDSLEINPNCTTTYCFEDASILTTVDKANNLSVSYDNSSIAWSVQDEASSCIKSDKTNCNVNSENLERDFSDYLSTKESKVLITHALYPAFKHGMQSNFLNKDSDFDYPVNSGGVVNENEMELGERTPLILIHGWQGDKSDANYINAYSFENSPEAYFKEFLAFFSDLENPVAASLRSKYKLYLFKYPSFEHITFNGRVLGELVLNNNEIHQHLKLGGKIDIVAHSMGGLVARSFIEEHGVGYVEKTNATDLDFDEQGSFNQLFDGKQIVNKLITLATPHHGSPGAGKHWVDLSSIAKETVTPGALDLMWDDFDGALSGNIYDAAKMQLPEACNEDYLNNEFCYFYFPVRNELENFDRVNGGWIFETSYQEGKKYRHPNPWLRQLNESYNTNNSEVQYYLYGGGLTSTELFPWQDFLMRNTLSNGFKMNVAFESIGDNAHYVLNDGVVPTKSAFIDVSGRDWNENGPNISSVFDGVSDFGNLLYKDGITPFGRGFNNYRYFHDYDHDKLRGGAGNTDLSDWSGSSTYDSDDNWKDSDDSPPYQYLDSYLEQMGTYFVGDDPEEPAQRLANEPLFLAIAEDLGVSLPKPLSNSIRFFDDFSGNLNSWQFVKYSTGLHGEAITPVIENEKLKITTRDQQYTLAVAGNENWSEYTVEADFQIAQSLDDAGQAFGIEFYVNELSNNGNNGNVDRESYAIQLRGRDNTWRMRRVHTASSGNNSNTMLSGSTGQLSVGVNYHMKLVIRNDIAAFYLNEIGSNPVKLFETTLLDDSLKSGKFGFSGGDSVVLIDNVKVETTGANHSVGLFDAFTDKNYSENLAWTAQNNDDRPGTIDMSNGYAHFKRSGVGGNGGSVGIDLIVDIPVTSDTTVRFDAIANSRSVGAGCGWTCGEYPANVRLYVEDQSGNEHIVQYSYNYSSDIQDRNDSVMTRFAYTIPQGNWVRDLEYNIREAWPQATKLTRVYLFAAGWDFNGAIDNIRIFEIGNPIVKSFKNFSLMEVNVDNLDYDMPSTIAPDIPFGYRLADWNDLVAYSNEGNDLEVFWNNIGQTNLMMTRNGDPTAAYNIYSNGTQFHRFYFSTWSFRPGQTPHSGFLSHASIGQMHLGSWTPRRHVLLIKD